MDGLQTRKHKLLKLIFQINISIHMQVTFSNFSLYFCMFLFLFAHCSELILRELILDALNLSKVGLKLRQGVETI